VFLSPSRALSSRPHIRVWSAAAAVSVGAGASGPGRGAVNGGGGRRSGGHAQPRAPETLDSQPHNFPGSAAAPGAWTEGEGEAGSVREAAASQAPGSRVGGGGGGGGGAGPCLWPPRPASPSPRRLGSLSRGPCGASQAAARGAEPSRAPARDLRALRRGRSRRAGGRARGSGRLRGREEAGPPARPHAQSPPAPGSWGRAPGGACGAGRPRAGGEDGGLNAERCGAEILLGSLLLLRHREHQEGGGQRAGAGAVPGRAAAQRRGSPGNAARVPRWAACCGASSCAPGRPGPGGREEVGAVATWARGGQVRWVPSFEGWGRRWRCGGGGGVAPSERTEPLALGVRWGSEEPEPKSSIPWLPTKVCIFSTGRSASMKDLGLFMCLNVRSWYMERYRYIHRSSDPAL
jgi:hypothetical protein